MKKKRSILFLFFCVFVLLVKSQSSLELFIEQEQTSNFFNNNNIGLRKSHPDTTTIYTYLDSLISVLHQKAYLEASLDSLSFEENKAFAKLHIGNKYQWLSLQNGNIPTEVLKAIRQKETLFQNKPINWQEVLKLQEQLLEYAEQNGFPFAEVALDSLQIHESKASLSTQVDAKLYWNLQQEVTFDNINIIGDSKINPQYIANFLGISPNQKYDKRKIDNISKQLKNLPYVEEKQAPKISFKDGKAKVNLFLDKKNTSRFDLLLGILPDNRPQLNRRQIVVTGNGLIDLVNAFNNGERFTIEFQQIRPQTQELNSHFSYPYLFNLPFGASIDFDLFKNDTSNLLIQYELGLQYLLGGAHYLKIFVNNQQSRLLTIDATTIVQQKTLPSNLDTKQSLFGIEYALSHLDNRLNPRKGWSALVRASTGEKVVVRNNSILELHDPSDPTFDFESLYIPFEAATLQYQLEGNFQYFLPLSKRSVLQLKSQNGQLLNQKALFENELYRIGGNQIQRGFDEESILASLYSINTIEYRWIFGQKSNLYLFADWGYIEQKTTSLSNIQQTLGLGAGIQLEVSTGIFGISLAVGKDNRNHSDFFDLRRPKIHFGYVNMF